MPPPPLLLLLLATASRCALGEMLHVHVPCPAALPDGACLASPHSGAVDWHRVRLPLTPTLDYLHAMLQTALEVEHSTIPLYLTTMYSIRDQKSFAARTMRGVVMEEMLHMVSAANVLNAIGGAPHLDHPDFIPKYPLTLPLLNMSADIVWFTRESINHYQVLESTPPGGYNTSISAAYLRITTLLAALCRQHGEGAVFSGNHSLQVESRTSYGQFASKVTSLKEARAALLGVADQGGGCPVTGHSWPRTVNISAGPLGGNVSHAARYEEILQARAYRLNDTLGKPTGPPQAIDWHNVRRFAPNPSVDDFLPEQCVMGGSWVVRAESFFVRSMWEQHNHSLATSIEKSWEDCALKCEQWTLKANQPLAPCAMWSWLTLNLTLPKYSGHVLLAGSCLLAQGGGPVTARLPGVMSGCQYGTVCNKSLPKNNQSIPRRRDGRGRRRDGLGGRPAAPAAPGVPPLAKQCQTMHQRGLAFAANYTALLVQLHGVFNGQPSLLGATIGAMYTLKSLAVGLMETPDPRIDDPSHVGDPTMGVGPPWEYIASASQYEARGRRARPLLEHDVDERSSMHTAAAMNENDQ